MTLLSDKGILRHMELGSIVIEPFRAARMNTDSYDLELGPFFWRYERMINRRPANLKRGKGFDLFDAREAGGINLLPGERVLGHSVEIAGGRTVEIKPVSPALDDMVKLMSGDKVENKVAVTTHLQATSTAGRHGLTACECAGYGDVGFVNIWVFEITNNLRDAMFLPVGAIIAQIAFTVVAPPSSEYGAITGNYQPTGVTTPADIRAAWTPESMLPKPLKVREGWRDVTWGS